MTVHMWLDREWEWWKWRGVALQCTEYSTHLKELPVTWETDKQFLYSISKVTSWTSVEQNASSTVSAEKCRSIKLALERCVNPKQTSAKHWLLLDWGSTTAGSNAQDTAQCARIYHCANNVYRYINIHSFCPPSFGLWSHCNCGFFC